MSFCRNRFFVPALLFVVIGFSGGSLLRGQSLAGNSLKPSFFAIGDNNALVNLAEQTGASRFYDNGIYGQNTTSWVVDAQLIGTNLFPALHFTNVYATYAAPDVVTDPGVHATWCAALLGGYEPPGYYVNTGIAPLTRIGSGALATVINSDGSFDISPASLSAYNYAASHGDVVSTSIGDSSDTAGVGIISGLLDAMARAHPNTTIAASAGNSGPAPGTVVGPASGYNTISVGALDAPPNYSTVASFSSRGPLQTAWYDGATTFFYGGGVASRPGVDLVAAGTDEVMPVEFNASSVTYYSISGTSFAAPLVAGGAALLDSVAKTAFSSSYANAATRSEVIKAVLMNSADKLAGWDNGQQISAGVITTTQALDWAMGAGRLNLNNAFTQYTTSAVVTTGSGISLSGFTDPVHSTGWAFGTAMIGEHNDYQLLDQLFSGQQIAVTLAWMRDRNWSDVLGDYVDVAQAELDLMVYRLVTGAPDVLVASSISPVGTVQELYFQITDPGTYLISVGYYKNLFDLSGTYAAQDYGLAWTVADVPEPSTWVLLSMGLCIVAWRVRSRTASVSQTIRKPATKNP
jgi:hypothetical protein